MIVKKEPIIIDTGIEYLSDWKDNQGRLRFDNYLTNGRLIVNKVATGCGFTTYCLSNNEHTILVSPRVSLLRNKIEQFNREEQLCYYFNREKDESGTQIKSFDDLENDFVIYCQGCQQGNRPLKLLVTYDSLISLANMLEHRFKFDINAHFRIAIDEAHCLIKDVPLKEYENKCVLSNFISKIFQYEKLLFISATPIVKYIEQIDEFKNNLVDYRELIWSNVNQVKTQTYSCRSPLDAFNQIYKRYAKNSTPSGFHFFDVIYRGGSPSYSTEAVIFLNSVKEIGVILNKYINKKKLIDIQDVSIICAQTKENIDRLHTKVDKNINILTSIPKYGQRHTTWTFVTRTAFEGVDFYSQCASSYVVANYNVESLCIDIASDIPQIIGRQRVKSNPFRETLHIFFTNNARVINDAQFEANQLKKMEEAKNQIAIWKSAPDFAKGTALDNINILIVKSEFPMYVKTVNGYPEINNLTKIAEQYCRDILKNHTSWFVMSSTALSRNLYNAPVQNLKDELTLSFAVKPSMTRIKKAHEYFLLYPQYSAEIFQMLHNEGFNDIARYFSSLSLDRIKANGFDTSKMDNEIANLNKKSAVDPKIVASKFKQGEVYSKKAVKEILQDLYNSLGIKQTAKANELEKYISCSIVKKDGLKAYKIN